MFSFVSTFLRLIAPKNYAQLFIDSPRAHQTEVRIWAFLHQYASGQERMILCALCWLASLWTNVTSVESTPLLRNLFGAPGVSALED